MDGLFVTTSRQLLETQKVAQIWRNGLAKEGKGKIYLTLG